MPRNKDLTGMKFGSLVVLEKADGKDHGYYQWKCQCDCKRICIVNTKTLKNKKNIDCGFHSKKVYRGSIAHDLTNQKFGQLTVIKRAENTKRVSWVCQCICGKQVVVRAQDLKSGKVISCGCHRKYPLIQGKIDLKNQRFGRLVAQYSTCKRNKKGSVYWHCVCDCGNELDVTEDCLVHGHYKSCGCLKQEIKDSINQQLTFVDGSCVQWLKHRKSRKDNKSGFRGIYPTPSGKWKVMIGLQNKRFYIGTFDSYEKAIEIRLNAESVLHDGFVQAYESWQAKSQKDPEWAKDNPFFFKVIRQDDQFQIQTNVKEKV